ncbi:MAG: phage tail sheath family protein [Nitrosomonas sp.]|nr:phage tail sheath family protein [Nitrosomonas sp.]
MPNYLSPGIYVEEVSTGAKPIGMVGTSVPAFLGLAPAKNKHVNQAIACNNWGEFCRYFVNEDSKSTHLAQAVFSFFNNHGSRCYIVNVGENGSISGDVKKRSGLYALETIDEVAIVAAPGYSDAISYEALLSHCEKLQDRIAILDAPESVSDINALKTLKTVSSTGSTSTSSESGESKPATDIKIESTASQGLRPRNSDEGYGAFYFPWFRGLDALQPNSGSIVNIPPSGAIAGIYARTDATRGVHKAPANEQVRGALGLTYNVSREEHGELNRKGVNVIRMFPDGIRIWGARTLAAEASEWRYIPVRRTFNMIKESIQEGTRWTVFEPNDMMTWKSVERDIRAFLMRVWRDGALLGATPEQAFFVKCDAETNPPEVRDAGQLIAEIGIAPVKPAEFIVFRIGQWTNETESATSTGV